MSCFVAFDLHLDPSDQWSTAVEKVLSELMAAGFRAVDEETGDLVEDGMTAVQFLQRGEGLDRGFGIIGSGDLEMSLTFRAEPGVAFVQTVDLSVIESYFRGPLMDSRIPHVLQLIRHLHKVLDARRTIGERGLEDGLVNYNWIDEWHRLEKGQVQGTYWLDIVRADLASQEYEDTRRALVVKPAFFKRFPWGTYFRLRIAP